MAIEQWNHTGAKELTEEQKLQIIKQLSQMVDFTIEWVDEDKFYLRSVELSVEARSLGIWVEEEKEAAEKISNSIREITEVAAELMSIDSFGDQATSFRKQLTEKYGEVFPKREPPVPFLVFNATDTPDVRKMWLTNGNEVDGHAPGCIGYNMGNNNIVVIYDYPGRAERSAEEEEKSAKSFWERFCNDNPNMSWKNNRLHVVYGRSPVVSEDGNYHYAVALNRSVDATFTPVIVS